MHIMHVCYQGEHRNLDLAQNSQGIAAADMNLPLLILLIWLSHSQLSVTVMK